MAAKTIIIFNSRDSLSKTMYWLEELSQKGFSLCLLTSSAKLAEEFRKRNWTVRTSLPIPGTHGSLAFVFYILLFPFHFLYHLFLIWEMKRKEQIAGVVCFFSSEKILAAPITRLLKIRNIWMEHPELEYSKINRFLFALYRFLISSKTVLIFNNATKAKIEKGGPRANYMMLPPCIKISQMKRQDNIYERIAPGNSQFHKKYFSIGTIVNFDLPQKLDILFHAVNTALTVIPNIQLIVIGEGSEKKNLQWKAKKMQIDNLVWFIGRQEYLKKWMDNFDLFISVAGNPNLDDMCAILSAMSSGLPVIALKNAGLEDLIAENDTGSLIEMDQSEMLARQIIKLHQEPELRKRLGANAREQVDKNNTIDKMVEVLEKVFMA